MSFNNSKKQKHISFLRKVGFLMRFNDLELYHGRSGAPEEDWCVKTDIDNSHSENSNNIMSVPCLCVASFSIAESYARGTSLNGMTGKMKIHEIVATDDDALVINEKFDVNKLKDGEAIKFFQAIEGMTSGVLKKFFEQSENGLWLIGKLRETQQEFRLIEESRENEIFQVFSEENRALDLETVENVVSAINTQLYFQRFPLMMASNHVFDDDAQRKFMNAGGMRFRLNQDYLRFLFDQNNVIALNKKKYSGVNDYIVYVFNLGKVQTLEKLQDFQK